MIFFCMQVHACIEVKILDQTPEETREKILQSTATLMKQKGFKAVTTRSIAREAQVNESTVFRHFGSKQGILNALVEKYSYVPAFEKAFENVDWNLKTDLMAFAKSYQEFMDRNGEFVLIGLKEAGTFPELDEKVANVPKRLKLLLMQYFNEMGSKNLLSSGVNVEALAMNFIWINLGFFMSKSLYGEQITTIQTDEFLSSAIHTFVDGINA